MKIELKRQELIDIQVEVAAERKKDKEPFHFTTVPLHYILKDKPEKEKVEKNLSLSLEKYCFVAKILKKTTTVSHS